MRVVKAVKQNYQPTTELLRLIEDFRFMVNDCLRIGIRNGITSLKSMSLKAYHELSAYDLPSYYKLCAISKACGILKNHRKAARKNPHAKTPYAKRIAMTTCYGFKIKDGKLKLPVAKRHYIEIPLNAHSKEILSHSSLTVRSVSLTAGTISVTYSKEAAEITPVGHMGIDRNLNNVTIADTAGHVRRLDLSKAAKTKARYRKIVSHFKRNDARLRRKVLQKYGSKERKKIQQILHHASKIIVQQAKSRNYGILMEKLTGVRKLYRRGNGQGSEYRFRLNSWSYAELQRQIEYKARWEGLPVQYVKPHGTSTRCSKCGSRMAGIPEENRLLKCQSCGFMVDRDVNAARNILARALRFGADASPTEAMAAEPSHETIRKVDGDELTVSNAPTS